MATNHGPSRLTWRSHDEPGYTIVEFSGPLDENADFAPLRAQLAGRAVFNLAGVRRINSFGAREWVHFLRDLHGVTFLTLTHCSPPVVMQLNMLHAFRGKAEVASFIAPYACTRCGREEERLLHVATHFPGKDFSQAPKFPCTCKGEMELDDVAERYLEFLKES